MSVTLENLQQQTFPRLLGGKLCLDFANTVEDRAGHYPEEFLLDFSSLIAWGLYTKSLDKAYAKSLLKRAQQRTKAAASVFASALTLRESIYKIFETIAADKQPNKEEIFWLSQSYQHSLRYASLASQEEGYYWRLTEETEVAPESVLWPILHSAITLLTLEELARVKRCPGADGCGWLFFDESKNRSRHWCSMEGCGSQAKMREQYRRKQKAVKPL